MCEDMLLIVGFDHGLPCRVKNMARGTHKVFVVTEARGPCFSHGMGDHDQMLL